MAITIVSSPDKFTPAFNPVVYTISSDNYNEPSFKFVADVYSGAQLLGTAKLQPQVNGSLPVQVDISRLLEELVAANYCQLDSTMTDIVNPAGGAIASYRVEFGEEYDGTTYANLNSASGFVFNGGMNYYRFPFYSQATYLGSRFLTYLDRQVVRKQDSLILSILQSDLAAIASFGLVIRNAAGTSLYSSTISNPYNSLAITNNRLLHLHVGFDFLFAELDFNTTVYNQAAYYEITPSGGTTHRVYLHSRCERFPGRRLYFLNELGGFDGFNFMLTDRESQKVAQEAYMRAPSNRATGYDASARRFEAQRRVFNMEITERHKLQSDYLTDAEAEQLKELFSSPLIYMEADATNLGGTGKVLIPVAITLDSYDVKQTRLDKLFTVEVDIELTQMSVRQKI